MKKNVSKLFSQKKKERVTIEEEEKLRKNFVSRLLKIVNNERFGKDEKKFEIAEQIKLFTKTVKKSGRERVEFNILTSLSLDMIQEYAKNFLDQEKKRGKDTEKDALKFLQKFLIIPQVRKVLQKREKDIELFDQESNKIRQFVQKELDSITNLDDVNVGIKGKKKREEIREEVNKKFKIQLEERIDDLIQANIRKREKDEIKLKNPRRIGERITKKFVPKHLEVNLDEIGDEIILDDEDGEVILDDEENEEMLELFGEEEFEPLQPRPPPRPLPPNFRSLPKPPQGDLDVARNVMERIREKMPIRKKGIERVDDLGKDVKIPPKPVSEPKKLAHRSYGSSCYNIYKNGTGVDNFKKLLLKIPDDLVDWDDIENYDKFFAGTLDENGEKKFLETKFKDWFVPSMKFYEALCEKGVKRTQNGDIFTILRDDGSSISFIVGYEQHLKKDVLPQTEQLFNKIENLISDRTLTEYQRASLKLGKNIENLKENEKIGLRNLVRKKLSKSLKNKRENLYKKIRHRLEKVTQDIKNGLGDSDALLLEKHYLERKSKLLFNTGELDFSENGQFVVDIEKNAYNEKKLVKDYLTDVLRMVPLLDNPNFINLTKNLGDKLVLGYFNALPFTELLFEDAFPEVFKSNSVEQNDKAKILAKIKTLGEEVNLSIMYYLFQLEDTSKTLKNIEHISPAKLYDFGEIEKNCENIWDDIDDYNLVVYLDENDNKSYCFNIISLLNEFEMENFTNPHTGRQFDESFISYISHLNKSQILEKHREFEKIEWMDDDEKDQEEIIDLEDNKEEQDKKDKTSLDFIDLLFSDIVTLEEKEDNVEKVDQKEELEEINDADVEQVVELGDKALPDIPDDFADDFEEIIVDDDKEVVDIDEDKEKKCEKCSKIIDKGKEYKSIMYKGENLEEVFFCELDCMENFDNWKKKSKKRSSRKRSKRKVKK